MKLQSLTLGPTKEYPFNYEPSKLRLLIRDVSDISKYEQKIIIVSGQSVTAWTNGYGWFREVR